MFLHLWFIKSLLSCKENNYRLFENLQMIVKRQRIINSKFITLLIKDYIIEKSLKYVQ